MQKSLPFRIWNIKGSCQMHWKCEVSRRIRDGVYDSTLLRSGFIWLYIAVEYLKTYLKKECAWCILDLILWLTLMKWIVDGSFKNIRYKSSCNKVFCESSVDCDSVDTAIQQQIIYFTLMIILRRKESENSWWIEHVSALQLLGVILQRGIKCTFLPQSC